MIRIPMVGFNSTFDSRAWLAALVESSDDAIIGMELNGIINSWNRGAEEIFGYTAEEIVGQSIQVLIPEDRRPEENHILESIKRGERIKQYNTIRRRKNGRKLYVSLSVSPIFDDNQKIVGVSKIARDITDQVQAREAQTLLLHELSHRSKNLLAVADVIVRQTAKRTSARELVERIGGRLQALSVNQDLMVNEQWRHVELQQVVRCQLEPIIQSHEDRINVSGPFCLVNPRVAQAIGLAIYELTNNAQKYGALSTPKGYVKLTWSLADTDKGGREFTMRWREYDGPPVKPPRKRGFGTTIIQQMVANSVLGKASIKYLPSGFEWTLIAAEEALSEPEASRSIS